VSRCACLIQRYYCSYILLLQEERLGSSERIAWLGDQGKHVMVRWVLDPAPSSVRSFYFVASTVVCSF
jgi:hypothetical protein